MKKTVRAACRATALAVILAALVPMSALGEEAEDRSGESEHGEHEPNLFAIFLGFTKEDRRDGAAVGLEYERRLSPSFGIGLLAEHTFGDFDTTVYAVTFAYHTGDWKLTAAPGIEDGEEGSEDLVRVGVEYGFEVGSWEVAPQLDVDFVEGEQVYVLGVAFGFGF